MDTSVYFNDSPSFIPPDEKFYYILARNGLFVGQKTPFYTSIVPTAEISELEDLKPRLILNLPKLFPRELLEKTVGFFDAVRKRYDSEAIVLITWDTQKNEFGLVCPDQTVPRSGMSVHYEVPNFEPHILFFGTIHSHVTMSAFASGTDTHDEENRPGIHVVIGCIDKEPPQFHLEWVAGNTRFMVAPELFFEGYSKRSPVTPEIKDWVSKVKLEAPYSWKGGNSGYPYSNSSYPGSGGGYPPYGGGIPSHYQRGGQGPGGSPRDYDYEHGMFE